jgi:FtsP/CotA-like multicopper oxidase with cupredoxin domain
VTNRRSFLEAVGRAGKAAAAAYALRSGATILAPTVALLRADPTAAQGENVLTQPPEIRSRNGVLSTTIVAAPGRVQMGDVAFPGLLYNGSYVPPLLRARLGDVMRITFDNGLPVNPRICTATA